jgi:dihydroorotate dehydrogenase
MDAETAHEWTIRLLEAAQYSTWGRWILQQVAGKIPYRPIELFGLTFPNELGVAAGFDKDVRVAAGLSQLGFGHVEVGTLTPKPQEGHARPRIFRLREDQALINRMGFPNCGVSAATERLKKCSTSRNNYVVGVSLGKQKETPLESAADDYQKVMKEVYSAADYLVVNISSPNTPGLRNLQSREHLGRLLGRLSASNQSLADSNNCDPKPMLLKLAPDLTWSEIDKLLEVASEQSISGIIATNTTLRRDGLISPNQLENGGLSGTPLFERSLEVISYVVRQLPGKLPVIGVGGVSSVNDVAAMLAAGASLVQIYTGLVYQGPQLAGRILRAL